MALLRPLLINFTPTPSFVSSLLLSLNVSTKHDGFTYLREAVILMAKNPGQSVTKVLYPEVAHICGCNKDNV